jgi:hypothetical protein
MRRTQHASPISNHKFLVIILLIFTILTVYQSISLPLGEADDETDHYQYLRFVARTGHPPLTEAERKEAGFKGGLAPLYYWLVAWPIALTGEDTLPDIRRVDSRPERHIPTDGLGINHVLHTLDEAWPWRGQVLAWHLVRFLSVLMGWITIIATYALARRLWPEPQIIAIGAAAFVAFLPRFVISSSVINDDNLVFALTTLVLLIQVIILQNTLSDERRASPGHFAIFGFLLGLTLITKYFSLILIPEVIFTLVIYWITWRPRTADHRPPLNNQPFTPYALRSTHHTPRLTCLLTFLIAFILTAGPWFAFTILRFNRIAELGLIPGLAASLGEPQITEGLVGLLSGQSVRPVAATYTLPEWFSLLYRSFWFEFGWMQLFAPAWVYGLFSVFLLCALIGHGLRLTSFVLQNAQDARPKTPHVSIILWLLGLHLALFLIVVLARYILSATIDTGQGRHIYPALPVIALFVSLGLFYFGFWTARLTGVDFGFKIFPFFAPHILPAILRILPTPHHLQFFIYYLLSTIFYLLPAAYCLLSPSLTAAHYQTLPITTLPPDDLPITYRHTLQFADGLFFAGFDVAQTATAGDVLPVTLYWRAEQEAQQDYLVSLCLQDQDNRPVACWAGHFANGRYPARAWEVGDTLRDTVFIPIPTCYRMTQQTYHLHLEIWPLRPDSAQPVLEDSPILQQTFTAPSITIQATDSLLTNLPQTVDLRRGNQRLTNSTSLELREALTWIDYTSHTQDKAPAFIRQATGVSDVWSPLPELDQPLFLPCDDGLTPFAHLAHFIAWPTLPPGPYFPTDTSIPPDLTLSLNLRQRTFAPISSTLVFTPVLAPLSLEFPEQPAISFLEEWNAKRGTRSVEEDLKPSTVQPFDFAEPKAPYGQDKPSNLPTLHPSNLTLPLTIRWQARQWMAEPLVVALKLLDKDFQVGGERLATLGDRYPNVLWAPGEVVEETYPVQLQTDAPPGLYRLELSLLHLDKNLPNGYENLPLTRADTSLGNNLYPATFRLLDPADGTPPPHPLSAQLGDSVHLVGYDLNPKSKIQNLKSKITLALYWQSTAKIPTDFTVFTQLLGPDGQPWAQQDNPPQAGRYPTSAWAEQDSVVDRYTLTLPEDAPAGQYRLLVGMYDPSTGQRLPATINGQPQSDNAIQLTALTIENGQ